MKRFKRTIIDRTYFFLLSSSKARVKYLKKHKVFAEMGENIFYQSREIPVEPYLVKLHNNIVFASSVHIIPHDIIHMVFNWKNNRNDYHIHMGCVEIMDNVFLGSECVVLPNVKIGPNAIVAAGAVVTKDVPEGTIVGGNPAKVIGSFDDLMEKRKKDIDVSDIKWERADDLWNEFEQTRLSE